MMEAIAGMAIQMQSAKLAQNYSIALTKKTMDNQETIAANMLEMLPEVSAPAKGQYIDVYA